ncbi:MAG TPA: hypothetical protein VN611_15660 [Patescibacteria group bacterium]|nr:hypothetical protein [Patescibacteria group bacterium]
MYNNSRKTIAGFVAGAFLLVGVAVPMGVQAAAENYPSAFHARQAQKAQSSQRLAETFGVDAEEVQRYNTQGYSYKALGHASFLAKASGKPLSEVISLKTDNNSWKDVAQTLSITPEQRQAAHRDLTAAQLENRLQIPRQTSMRLLAAGHSGRDIALANLLAQKSTKSIDEVFLLHQSGTNWDYTATALGIDRESWQKDAQQLRSEFKTGTHSQRQ